MILDCTVEELERKVRNFICPFCNRKFNTIFSYLNHVNSAHPLKTCPVCGNSYRDIAVHFSKHDDRAHQLLWALYGSSGKGRHKRPKKLIEIRSELWE